MSKSQRSRKERKRGANRSAQRGKRIRVVAARGCSRKKSYRTRDEALQAIQEITGRVVYIQGKGIKGVLTEYPCRRCPAWHIGHLRTT